jgi:hypothetical protein
MPPPAVEGEFHRVTGERRVLNPEARHRHVALGDVLARLRVALGLVLPPFVVLWVRAPASASLAETHVTSGRVRVYIRDDLPAPAAFAAALHELQHVADHALVDRLSPDELERRAERFAARAGGATTMKETITMGNTTPTVTDPVARRAALGARGRAIADRIERERRLPTARERREFDAILRELDTLPRRPGLHVFCGGAWLPESTWTSRCARCGSILFGRN